MDPGPALTELLIHQCCWFAVLGTWISPKIRNVCKTVCKNAIPRDKPFFLQASPDKIKQAIKFNYEGQRFFSLHHPGVHWSQKYSQAILKFQHLVLCSSFAAVRILNWTKTYPKFIFSLWYPKKKKRCGDFPVRLTWWRENSLCLCENYTTILEVFSSMSWESGVHIWESGFVQGEKN